MLNASLRVFGGKFFLHPSVISRLCDEESVHKNSSFYGQHAHFTCPVHENTLFCGQDVILTP